MRVTLNTRELRALERLIRETVESPDFLSRPADDQTNLQNAYSQLGKAV